MRSVLRAIVNSRGNVCGFFLFFCALSFWLAPITNAEADLGFDLQLTGSLEAKPQFVSFAQARAGQQSGSNPQQQSSSEPRPLSIALLDKVPEDLREQARAHIRLAESAERRWLALTEEQLREAIVINLTRQPAVVEFMLDLLPKEPSARNRSNILNAIPYQAHWRNNIRTRGVLNDLVISDRDAGVIRLALEVLRSVEMQSLRSLLDRRIQAEQAVGNRDLVTPLAEEQERWLSLQRGAMLPAFMRLIPPVFSLKPAGQTVRVVAFGDFGRGRLEQKQVANAILEEHRKKPFDFGITTGDNFYPRGMESPSDARWQTYWEELYTPMKIKFYASLGNHDWLDPNSTAAEILYSEKSQSWRLPAPYYTYTAGPVQFFAVDTDDMGEKQRRWLKGELEKSTARWQVVYGHHPVYAASTFGAGYTEEMRKRLLPIIRGKADVYLCGHHHSLQHLKPDGGTHFFITGGGGASAYPVGEKDEERGEAVLFARSAFGFTVLEATEKELLIRHVATDGRELYRYQLTK